MSKLFKLKEWLTIPDAAKQLSSILQEDVSESDILQLCLDKHLSLSIVLHNLVTARRGTFHNEPSHLKKLEDDFAMHLKSIEAEIRGGLTDSHECMDEWDDAEEGEFTPLFINGAGDADVERFLLRLQERSLQRELCNTNEVLVFSSGYVVSGCYDLLMQGGEIVDIERLYFESVDKSKKFESNRSEGGVTLLDHGARAIYILAEEDNNGEECKRIKSLPDESILVVRTKAFTEFLRGLQDQNKPADKEIDPKTKNKLLALVKTLAQGLVPNLDEIIESPHKAAAEIDRVLARKGIKLPIHNDTLANYLEEANK